MSQRLARFALWFGLGAALLVTQLLLHERFHDVGEPEALLCPRGAEQTIVGEDRAAHRHAPGSSASFELPRVQGPRRLRTKSQAIVVEEILGTLRCNRTEERSVSPRSSFPPARPTRTLTTDAREACALTMN